MLRDNFLKKKKNKRNDFALILRFSVKKKTDSIAAMLGLRGDWNRVPSNTYFRTMNILLRKWVYFKYTARAHTYTPKYWNETIDGNNTAGVVFTANEDGDGGSNEKSWKFQEYKQIRREKSRSETEWFRSKVHWNSKSQRSRSKEWRIVFVFTRIWSFFFSCLPPHLPYTPFPSFCCLVLSILFPCLRGAATRKLHRRKIVLDFFLSNESLVA